MFIKFRPSDNDPYQSEILSSSPPKNYRQFTFLTGRQGALPPNNSLRLYIQYSLYQLPVSPP